MIWFQPPRVWNRQDTERRSENLP